MRKGCTAPSFVMALLVYAASAALAQQETIPITFLNEQGVVAPVRGPFVFGPADEHGVPAVQTCEQAVGERVRVEGIGWHLRLDGEDADHPLNPESLPRVIFEEGTVYIRGVDFDKAKAHGKLVRVVGALKPYTELNDRLKQIYAPTVGGCALELLHRREPPRYYLIEATSLEVLPSIQQPRLELQPDK
jgi:hypothetical protein